jgi:hypothetical protein
MSPTPETPYVPDLSVLSMEEIDAYLRPILAAQREAEDRALKMHEKVRTATSVAAREAYLSAALTATSVARGYAAQATPYLDEWQRRGCPKRRAMTRKRFLATPARDLVVFPEGRAPYVVVDRPKGVSQKTYDRHIDSAGKVVITWRLAEDDGRRFEQLLADAQSARAVWVGNDTYNHRWPTRDHRRIYLSARWAD